MSAPRRAGGRYVADPKTHDLTRTEAPTASDPRGDRPRDADGTPLGRREAEEWGGTGGTGGETSGPAVQGARARPAAEDGAAGSSIPSEPAASDPSASAETPAGAAAYGATNQKPKPAAKARKR